MRPAALCEIEVYYFTLGQENPVDGYDRDCHYFIISFQSVAPFFGCFASHVNCDWCTLTSYLWYVLSLFS